MKNCCLHEGLRLEEAVEDCLQREEPTLEQGKDSSPRGRSSDRSNMS